MTTKGGGTALNVYKKVAIIRKADDSLTYEDTEGNVKTINDLHLAAGVTAPIQKTKAKLDIPVPKIRDNETYKSDVPAVYQRPVAYVRHRKPSCQELRENLEYVIDAEDEVWLINNSKFGKASSQGKLNAEGKADEPSKEVTQLPIDFMEIMIDIMEKATAHDTIIRLDQAERLIIQRLPQIYHMYPAKGKSGIISVKTVIIDVYNYWVSKRSKLKRPLLRRFWPVTSSDDTNPHLVFRPREKEKYKLRKKRQNDMDAYRKMEQLRQDFAHVRVLCELVKQREELNRSLVLLQREWFVQKLHEAIDTSGTPRISTKIDKGELKTLSRVIKHFETGDSWRKKKVRRGSNQGGFPSRSTTPVPESSGISIAGPAGIPTGRPSVPQKKTIFAAGQNHGEPAPNFLNPLPTRESYRTSWAGVPPHVPAYAAANAETTFRFRHRSRVGRGGRICIDRLPLPPNPNAPTFFRAGSSQLQSNNKPKARLVDLLPPPLDHERISQRIEAISLNALKEDYEGPPPGGVTGIESEENDGEVVLVPTSDWLNTDDQLWGEERFSLGPF